MDEPLNRLNERDDGADEDRQYDTEAGAPFAAQAGARIPVYDLRYTFATFALRAGLSTIASGGNRRQRGCRVSGREGLARRYAAGRPSLASRFGTERRSLPAARAEATPRAGPGRSA